MKISFYVSGTESMVSTLVPTNSFSEGYSFKKINCNESSDSFEE